MNGIRVDPLRVTVQCRHCKVKSQTTVSVEDTGYYTSCTRRNMECCAESRFIREGWVINDKDTSCPTCVMMGLIT